MEKVIVLGSSHYNSIGVVQCLGVAGIDVILVMIGSADSLITKSNYVNEYHCFDNYQECIEYISKELVQSTKTLIIPCGDEAALLLERNISILKDNFVFQHCSSGERIERLMNKHVQVSIAKEAELDVPFSIEVSNISEISDSLKLPVIIKPSLSCSGEKNDITVIYEYSKLLPTVDDLLAKTPRLVIQEYISNNDDEFNILGYRTTDGKCIIPSVIRKLRIHPKGRGSVSVCEISPVTEKFSKIIRCIEKYMEISQYAGLFSVELLCSGDKIFFIETNYRNDALNAFVFKHGVNLPLIHYQDMCGKAIDGGIPRTRTLKMICEPMHMASVKKHSITFIEWLKDIITCDSFMLNIKGDKQLFYRQLIYKLVAIVKW